jgi:RNA polymerase sporulation-specific sigma factor
VTRSAQSVDERTVEAAGAEVGGELLQDDPVDLRDGIDPELRAAGPWSSAVPAPGCPCGCGETELVLKARAGDGRAADELVRRYRVLARTKARSYFLLGADREDVVQEGMIGVYKAIRDFDVSSGTAFRTFAELCVTRQIVSAVRAASRHKHGPLSSSVSIDRPVADGDDGPTLADVLPAAASADPAEALVSAEEVRALQQHFDEVLTDLEQQVLRHHLQGRSYEETSAMLQRHVKSVDNALQRIKRKIADHLEASQQRLAEV